MSDRDEFEKWWDKRHANDENEAAKKLAWRAWQAARAQGGEAVGFVTQSAMDQLRKGHPAKIYAPENRVVTMKPVIRLYANLGEPDK